MTAETDAIGRAITRLEQATVDEPWEYWQALLDDLEHFVDLENFSHTSVAFKYVVAVRDRTDPADTPEGRAAYIAEATFFRKALRFPP